MKTIPLANGVQAPLPGYGAYQERASLRTVWRRRGGF